MEDQDLSGLTGVSYLFGSPIAHSLSPLLHQTVYDALGLRWKQVPLESTDVARFLELTKTPEFYGASVTMPHKVSILQHLDRIDPAAREVGACNTIYVRRGPGAAARVLVGTNTDIVGIERAFYSNVADPARAFHGRPAVIIGAGGAARSAAYVLSKTMRATQIYLVNRDVGEVEALIAHGRRNGYGEQLVHVRTEQECRALPDPGAIVACVPDLEPTTAEEKQAWAVLMGFLDRPHKGAVLEMCYHPRPWTQIAAAAQQQGWQVIPGTEAMIYQGLEQDSYWTQRPQQELPLAQVKEAIAAALAAAT